jgi:hypothetical protein
VVDEMKNGPDEVCTRRPAREREETSARFLLSCGDQFFIDNRLRSLETIAASSG